MAQPTPINDVSNPTKTSTATLGDGLFTNTFKTVSFATMMASARNAPSPAPVRKRQHVLIILTFDSFVCPMGCRTTLATAPGFRGRSRATERRCDARAAAVDTFDFELAG
jgi:hypothetical protein